MRLTTEEASADATLIVVAATDTSIQTVLTVLRYLATDSSRQKKLRDEVNAAFFADEIDIGALCKLSYLDACIQESLRIVPPGPFGTSMIASYNHRYHH